MQPNIFFLDLDSLRADKFMGVSKSSITPNIDKLIKNGTYFSQSITAADGTIISLNATFNSQFPFRTGTRAKESTNRLNFFPLLNFTPNDSDIEHSAPCMQNYFIKIIFCLITESELCNITKYIPDG